MRSTTCSVLLGLVLAGVVPAEDREKSALEKDPKGWIDLLPGKDLSGWKRIPIAPDAKVGDKNPWSVSGKTLQCDGVGLKEMLLTDKSFGDGTFHVEWRFRKVEGKKDYNSGIYIRTSADGKVWHQVQVAHAEKPPLLGDLFGQTKGKEKMESFLVRGKGADRANAPGEWNTYEISAKGQRIEVWVNGARTCTWDECRVEKGHLGLQAEFFYIEFRNLKFRPARVR